MLEPSLCCAMEALRGALALGFKPGAALLVAAGKFQMDAANRRVGGGGRGGSLVEHPSPIVSQISIHMRPTRLRPVEMLQQRVAEPRL